VRLVDHGVSAKFEMRLLEAVGPNSHVLRSGHRSDRASFEHLRKVGWLHMGLVRVLIR